MMVVKITGGLGNQLFQYAFGQALAHKLGHKVSYDISSYDSDPLRKYDLHHFGIDIEFAPYKKSKRLQSARQKIFFKGFQYFGETFFKIKDLSLYKEQGAEFDNRVYHISDNTYLDGYWQNEKYFEDIKPMLIKQLCLRKSSSEKNKLTIKKIKAVNAVSVHIRRGDYISNSINQKIHGVCPLEYYEKSMLQMTSWVSDPVFFIFSDDIPWAKENLGSVYNMVFVDHNDQNTAHEDIHLMSNCKHNIIANSTFSWWGAWLNKNPEKKIIAPKKWFTDPTKKEADIIPEKWIRI